MAARGGGRGKAGAGGPNVTIRSYAKVNLSLDVGHVRPDGFHPVDMILQQLLFHDDVNVRFREIPGTPVGTHTVTLTTNRWFLPTDARNIAWKAAKLMSDRFGADVPGGEITVTIQKRIPVAAGLAGGSGNAAAVLHALNILWKRGLTLSSLMELGGELGSDVPFCVMGQAAANRVCPKEVREDPAASCCARATGTGTDLEPLRSKARPLVFAKPKLSVSTAEVYRGIDDAEIPRRPDNDALAKALATESKILYDNCINVLENYTLPHYPAVAALKRQMSGLGGALTMMSGSGPTIFSIFRDMEQAIEACGAVRGLGYEAYWTKTIV